jgi:hypothetical protein
MRLELAPLRRGTPEPAFAKMALPPISSPVAEFTDTPSPLLKAVTFCAPGLAPPITSLRPATILTPRPPLPRGRWPVTSVPIRLPWTRMGDCGMNGEGGLSMSTPSPRLPERRLPAPSPVPPIVALKAAKKTRTPATDQPAATR